MEDFNDKTKFATKAPPKVASNPIPTSRDRVERIKDQLGELSKRCDDLAKKLTPIQGEPLSREEKLLVKLAQLPMMREMMEEFQMEFIVTNHPIMEMAYRLSESLSNNFE